MTLAVCDCGKPIVSRESFGPAIITTRSRDRSDAQAAVATLWRARALSWGNRTSLAATKALRSRERVPTGLVFPPAANC
jgi:hypothetical protein